MFKKRETIKQVEEGNDLAPKFDKNGFIPTGTKLTSGDTIIGKYYKLPNSVNSKFVYYL